MKAKKILITLGVMMLLLAVAWPVLACEFSFNYRSIEAPLGVTGSIGVRVLKDHHDCSLECMDGYQFEWDKVQILGQSDWEEVSYNLFEKWFEMVLSERGEGYFMIWKDCEQEGYDEKILSVSVGEGGEEWQTAVNEGYPYPFEGDMERAAGPYELSGHAVVVGGKTLLFPETFDIPSILLDNQNPIVVYYTSGEQPTATLVTGEDVYLRFDQP